MQGQVFTPDLASFSWSDSLAKHLEKNETALLYARQLLMGTLEQVSEIDELLSKNINNWNFARVNKVDLSILRLSVYCLLYQKDLEPSMIISEALEISREFCSENSYRFINGVLDSISKKNN